MSQRRDSNGRFTSRKRTARRASNLFTRAKVLETLTLDEVFGAYIADRVIKFTKPS